MVKEVERARRLPDGLAPRLLSREAAAEYCSISPTTFDQHIVPAVPALKIGSRSLWDIKKLDRWLDEQAGFAHARPRLSLEDRLNGGDQGGRR